MVEKMDLERIPKLGFGLMRLPTKGSGRGAPIDTDRVAELLDMYLKRGFTYFDTAYFYHEGNSERIVGDLLVKNYPRESFMLADKLPMMMVNNSDDIKNLFDEQVRRTKVNYFDFYLQHGLDLEACNKSEKIGGWDFMLKLKEQGIAKHIGFSYHDTAEHLDEILTRHPETEFVQLQLNYLDWDSESVQSRLCYEVARKHKKPIVVMEPVKGGVLASLPPDAEKLFKDYAPEKSAASWALRFCASLEGMMVILSGMSTAEQLLDNMDTLGNVKPLSSEERKVLGKVLDVFNSVEQVPCTKCHYCVEESQCPQSIAIPEMISLLNRQKKFESFMGIMRGFTEATKDGGKPSDCISCGACEAVCPQHIEISAVMKEAAKVLEHQ